MKLITEEKLKVLLTEAYNQGCSDGRTFYAIPQVATRMVIDKLVKKADEHEPLTKEVTQ